MQTFDFSKEPGKQLKKIEYDSILKPKITIVMPFYNDKDYIEQSVTCVLNQTFPLFELIIIDDGSKDEQSLALLEKISKWDKRIKVFHKQNEGLAATRDFGAQKSSPSCEYLFFLDSDDLIEDTYLECAYWSLQMNPKAAWAYADLVGFGANEYTWNKFFDSERMKTENILVATALIRKKDFWEVNGYELREKAINEDWNFWLKMIAKGKFPVRLSYYAFWYRRKKNVGELSKANQNKKRTQEILAETIKNIKKKVTAIQYPRYNYNWELIKETREEIEEIKEKKTKRINLLYIIPWMVMGGADKFNIDFINGLDRNKFEVTILTTEPAQNIYRQSYQDVTIYDLTSFLDVQDWLPFINYIIKKKNINLIMNSNSEMGYAYLPYLKAKYPTIPIIDYIHMEEWYHRNGGYSRDSSTLDSILDLTMTCNENSKRILIDNFQRNEKNLQTVYIGVDENKFNPKDYSKEEWLKYYSLPTDKLIISYICRLSNQKRPFLLLEIIHKYIEKNKNVLFLIVGDGPLLNDVKNKVNELGLNEYIRFMGSIQETQRIYAVSDITINCSIKEGLALTSYESLAMNVPVISSNVGGQKELINQDVGIIVSCNQKEEDVDVYEYSDKEINQYVEAIEKISKNLDKYSKNCRKRILNGFTISQMIANMNKILEEIVDHPNKYQEQNGNHLKNCIDITKELITKEYLVLQPKYSILIDNYNKAMGLYQFSRFQAFKNTMWKYTFYRSTINKIKKTRLFKIIKKGK